ncbi:hypothetical protein KC799_05520 [candidate division KSB1 bacterium]|nr:hypothetical protein [candidate division KSB1 bacterium]
MHTKDLFYASLICPITRMPLKLMSQDQVQAINDKINHRAIVTLQKQTVTEIFTNGLTTEDGRYFYRIDDDIPILLPDEAMMES